MLGLVADQTSAAHERSKNWREVSRMARVRVAKGQHEEGINAYRQAIKILKASDPENEAVLDLQINLAQTFRLANRPAAAMRVLDKVKSRFGDDAKFLDPLLPRRYWRAKAAVALDVGDINGYVKWAEHTQRIMNENFSLEWKRNAQELSDLVAAECKHGKVESAVQRLDAAALEPIWELDKAGMRRDIFANISLQCQRPLVSMVAQDPDRAAKAIATLSKFEPRVQNLSYLWWVVFCQRANMKMSRPDDFILSNVSALLPRAQKGTNEESLHAQVDLHSIRSDIYRHRSLGKEERAELRAIAKIVDQPHPGFSDGWRELCINYQLKLATLGAPDEARKRLLQAKKVCESPLMTKYWSERQEVHDCAVLDIVRAYLDRNDVKSSEEALRKHSLQGEKNRPQVLIRVLLIHLGRAVCFYKAGKTTEARREYAVAKHFVEKLPASRKDRAELVNAIEAYKQLETKLSELETTSHLKVSR